MSAASLTASCHTDSTVLDMSLGRLLRGSLRPTQMRPKLANIHSSAKCMAKKRVGGSAKQPDPADGKAGKDKEAEEKARRAVMADLNARFGKGTIMMLEDDPLPVPCFSSGSLMLDVALGRGMPRGKVIEIFGPEATGKTTLAMHSMLEVQRAGGSVAFIDVEHAFDRTYGKRMGLKLDEVMFTQPDDGEQALETVDTLVRSGTVQLIVVDSVAAMLPKAELEAEVGQPQMALQARLMSQGMRKIPGMASKFECSVIFINQLRSKVGIIFGSPEITSGGNALKYAASVRIDLRKKGFMEGDKKEGAPLGIRVKAKIVKNKVAPPGLEVEYDLVYGKGISREGSVLDAAEHKGIVVRKGAWYYLGEEGLGQGRANVLKEMLARPELYQRIETAVVESLAATNIKAPAVGDEEIEEGDEDFEEDGFDEGGDSGEDEQLGTA